MNFDDLHDPDPPRPGTTTLAAVAGRARQIRRRRTALVAAGGVLAAVAVVVPAALVVTGDEASERMVPATVPDTEPPTATTFPARPSTVVPPSTTGAPTTTTTRPLLPSAMVAILGNGDAVMIDVHGVARLLHDGADPGEVPEEGEHTVVDSVIVTPDGRAFVSTCCEPVPGAWFEVGTSEQAVEFGHGLALSPDGQRIASVGAQGVTITDLDGIVLASADLAGTTPYRQPESVMWLDDDTLAVIELRQPATGNEFRLYTVDTTLDGVARAEGVAVATDIEATWPHFGGVADDGSILVYRGERGGTVADTLEAHDPATLERAPASDIVIAGNAAAVDAWYRDGLLTWVGSDDVLHVGDVELPIDAPPSIANEFAWARPAG